VVGGDIVDGVGGDSSLHALWRWRQTGNGGADARLKVCALERFYAYNLPAISIFVLHAWNMLGRSSTLERHTLR